MAKVDIKIPQMGESVSQATIGAFLKPEGSPVQENEEIIELETEKVNQVLYAPKAGVIHWQAKQGDNCTIGQIIGFIEESTSQSAPPPPPPPPAQKEREKVEIPPPKKKEEGQQEKVRLGQKEFVQGLSEKENVIETPKREKKEKKESRRKMSPIRKTIANRLVESLHQSAMLTTFNEVDMTQVIALRAKYKESFVEKHQVKLGFMSFFVKAVVEGLKSFPDLNSYIDADDIVTRGTFDIGIAVSTERGLVVPVIRECDTLTFAQIEKAIVNYAKTARDKKLKIEDLSNGGFTITNGGIFGSLLSTPILNPPPSWNTGNACYCAKTYCY